MSLVTFKKAVDNKFLVGVSLKSTFIEDIPDRVFNISPRVNITFDKARLIAGISFSTPTSEAVSDMDNITDILYQYDLWTPEVEETPSDYTSGELILLDRSPKKVVTTIKGITIEQHSFNIPITESGKVGYSLTFTFLNKRYLHGLSAFVNSTLTLANLEKIFPFIVDNSFGEIPTLVRVTIKGTKDDAAMIVHLVPNGLDNFVYTNTKNKVWLFNSIGSRLGVDMSGAKATIAITDNGYKMTITLKKGNTIEVFM